MDAPPFFEWCSSHNNNGQIKVRFLSGPAEQTIHCFYHIPTAKPRIIIQLVLSNIRAENGYHRKQRS